MTTGEQLEGPNSVRTLTTKSVNDSSHNYSRCLRLEEMVRQETIRQIEFAWDAHRKLCNIITTINIGEYSSTTDLATEVVEAEIAEEEDAELVEAVDIPKKKL